MATKIAQLEALLYVAGDNGIDIPTLMQVLELGQREIEQLIAKLKKNYEQNENSGLQIVQINDLYKMTNSSQTGKTVEKYFAKDMNKTLSQSALEILAIVAYKQPITRVEIDDIRGVNSAAAIQTLIWRGLIKTEGKKDAPGHPNLYVTTNYFLQYFNYRSLADLPLIEEFEDNDEESNTDLFSDDND